MIKALSDFRSKFSFLIALAICAALTGWLLPSPGPASAATVSGLYSAQVPVQGQGTEQRNRAIREAFGKVLVKVSGHRGIAGRKELAGDLRDASRYVQQYRYSLVPAASESSDGQSGGGEPGRLLRVTFDEQAVTRLLRERRLPVWGTVRPSILVWLGLEQQGRRTLYLGEADDGPRRAIDRAAEDRGLPILFPLLDLEDQSRLQASDLWGGFESRIRDASQRYGPDAILTGRLSRRGGQWRAVWTLYQADDQASFEDVARSPDQAVARGIPWVADVLAARYAPVGADQSVRALRLRVAGIDDLAAYAHVSSFLGSLDLVDRFTLISVAPTVSTFELTVSGDRDALQRGLALGGLLEPDLAGGPAPGDPMGAGPESADPGVTMLYYRFRQ